MKMSSEGRRALVETFEGLACVAYCDCVGVLTIGYGHTSRAGAPIVHRGMRITAAEADQILGADLAKVEAAVSRMLRKPALQREFDAFCSLAFNVGCGDLRSSTALRLFNAGRAEAAALAFLAWERAGGRVLPGLQRRRQAERAWFLGRAPGEPPILLAASSGAHIIDHPDSAPRRAVNRVALAMKRRAA